jgi:hypothetical protein
MQVKEIEGGSGKKPGNTAPGTVEAVSLVSCKNVGKEVITTGGGGDISACTAAAVFHTTTGGGDLERALSFSRELSGRVSLKIFQFFQLEIEDQPWCCLRSS